MSATPTTTPQFQLHTRKYAGRDTNVSNEQLLKYHLTPQHNADIRSTKFPTTVTQIEAVEERKMKDAMAPLPIRRNTRSEETDPRLLAGYLSQTSADDQVLHGPKRSRSEATNVFEHRHAQDASLNVTMGMNYVDVSERRMPASAKTMFSTATFGHSPEEQGARSDAVYARSMSNPIAVNTYNGARGVTHLQHFPGTTSIPVNSRR
jgi:hypothetical protein